jgi:serine/threonine protein kinase
VPSHHPGDRIDNYEVKDLLGAGGWAEVFRAIDTRTGKTVVLKCPNSQLFADPAAFSSSAWVAASSGRWGHSSLTVISREARPPTTGYLAGDADLLCVNNNDNDR